MLFGKSKDSQREAHYYFSGYNLQAVRQGSWKLAIAAQPDTKDNRAAADDSTVTPRLYNLESAAASGRHGLLGMRERVTLAGGTLDVESYPGGGTTVLARIPLSGSEGSVVNKDS